MPPHLLTVALGLALHLGLNTPPPRHSRHGRPVATASLPTDLASSGSDEPLQDRPLTKLLGDGKLLDDDVRGADGEDELGALPPVGNLLRELRPSRISVVEVPLDGNAELLSRTDTFVNTFRGCAPYIKMHSGKVMVIHMASVLLDKPQIFDEMMEDIASMSVLGVRIVLVVGIRDQVDARLDAMNVEVKYAGLDRVSDPETLRVVQEVSGYARSRVEGSFARGVKGLARVMSGGVGIDVVGGNFYYTAQPLGVRNGIDYGATGEVRRVETEKVRSHLNNGEIVLMTSLGYSGSGDVFNVQSEAVAARAAAALGATKLIYLTPLALVQRVRRSEKKGEESVRYGVPTRGLEEMGYEVRRPPAAACCPRSRARPPRPCPPLFTPAAKQGGPQGPQSEAAPRTRPRSERFLRRAGAAAAAAAAARVRPHAGAARRGAGGGAVAAGAGDGSDPVDATGGGEEARRILCDRRQGRAPRDELDHAAPQPDRPKRQGVGVGSLARPHRRAGVGRAPPGAVHSRRRGDADLARSLRRDPPRDARGHSGDPGDDPPSRGAGRAGATRRARGVLRRPYHLDILPRSDAPQLSHTPRAATTHRCCATSTAASITCTPATRRCSRRRCSSGTAPPPPSSAASWSTRRTASRGAATRCSRSSSARRSPPE